MLALLRAGADPMLKNKRGETVFDMNGLNDQAMRELARFQQLTRNLRSIPL